MEYSQGSTLLYELYRFRALVKDNDLKNPNSRIYSYSLLSDEQKNELSSLCSALYESTRLLLRYRRSLEGNAYGFLHRKLLFINDRLKISAMSGAIPSHGYDETKRELTDTDVFLKKLTAEISSRENMRADAQQHHQGTQSDVTAEQVDTFERDGARILEEMRGKAHLARAEMRSDADAILEKIKKESDDIQKESYVIIEKVKEAAGLVGVTESEKNFTKQEINCRDRRKAWGYLTLAFVGAVLCFSFIVYFFPMKTIEGQGIYQDMAFRITTLAVLISAAAWCGKIYKALYHQEMINNHKALCLKTMWAFAYATENKDDRNTIVIQASKAVFGNVPTGFVQERSSDSDFNMFTVANQLGRHGSQTQ